MKTLVKITNTIWTLAVILDIWSTIILRDWHYEENPFIRYFWHNFGDIGLIGINFFFYLLVLSIPYFIHKLTKSKLLNSMVLITVIALSLFKILIALTNFGIAPYYLTEWFQY